MRLEKLSASALNSADMCLARWKAERDAGYGASMNTVYAMLGSSVHGALEDFVRMFYIEKKGTPKEEFIIALYKKHYMNEFATADLSGYWYEQGLELITKWYHRTDFSYFDVVSAEVKEYFQVKTSIGMIPITYIIDRLDNIEPGVYRVTDYKTSNELLNPDLLKKKIQALIYGLAIQIKYPDAQEVWVEFDMLRFGPVSICLTREDNAATYRRLQRAAERIIECPEERVPETLNPQCGWCLRKTTCKSVQANIQVGGVFEYEDLTELAHARALLEFQRKAAADAVKELDSRILAEMENQNEIEFNTDLIELKLTMSKGRELDTDTVVDIVGEETFRAYGGGKSMLLGDFDKMVRELGGPVAAQLKREAVNEKYGDPRVQVKPKGEFVK